MRSLLALLLFSLSAAANATLIQYDLRGNFGTTAVSVLLDTAGATSEFNRRFDADGNPQSCFFNFGATLKGQVLGASIEGTPALDDIHGIPGVATVGGPFRDTSCTPGNQNLSSMLSISADTYQFDFAYRLSTSLPTADEVLATADPLATVLLNGQLMIGDVSLRTATDQLGFFVDELIISEVTAEVPEPPVLSLLSLGLAGLFLGRASCSQATRRGRRCDARDFR